MGTGSEARIDPLGPYLERGEGAQGKERARFRLRPRRPEPLPPVEGILAGAAEADITPPPGLPKAGYSANAHDGSGYHTRLRARITHLRSGTASLGLVQLDLLGGSSVLQHLVAEAIADRTDIPLAGVWIGATHTHAGPGQFLGSDFYNQHASNRPGFDPAWTQFLVDRIAGAIIEAHDSRVPARVAFGNTEVWGLTRNRSHDPHVQNRTVTDKRRDPQRKWVAINPLLHLLRVDRITDSGGTAPLAAAAVFSIHGTGISQHAQEYNADVWAYLVGELRHLIGVRHGSEPVVGAMEGTHADMAPALRPGLAGHREAARIGRGIGAEAAALYDRLGSELVDRLALDVGLSEIDLDREQNRTIDGVELPDRPAVGAALVAGAKENLTPVINRLPPFRAGLPKPFGNRGAQGVKWVLGSRWLQPLVLPKSGFPRVLAVQVVRLGGTALVGLPFEVTVEAGRRVAEAVTEAVGERGISEVVVSSVVNEYWGYVTTPEEYSRQFYEGGHTLYGPNTAPFVASHTRRVASATVGAGVHSDPVPERRWDLRLRRFLPATVTTALPERRFISKAGFTDPTSELEGFWEQEWLDAEPAALRWHEPLLRVESSDDDGATWVPATRQGRLVDDQGWALEVTHLGSADEDQSEPEAHRYRVRWFDPDHRFGRRHRFVLAANNTRPELAGDPFD